MTKEFVKENDDKILFSDERLRFYKTLVEIDTCYNSDPRVRNLYTVLSDLLTEQRVYDNGGFLLGYMAKEGFLEKHSIQRGYFYESAYYTLVDPDFVKSVFNKNAYLPTLSHLKLIEKKLINGTETI